MFVYKFANKKEKKYIRQLGVTETRCGEGGGSSWVGREKRVRELVGNKVSVFSVGGL